MTSNILQGPNWQANAGLDGEVDFPALVERLWLKAEAARWAAERSLILDNDPKKKMTDRVLFHRANNLQSTLWMLSPHFRAVNIDDLNMLAACYESLAEVAATTDYLLQRLPSNSEDIKSSLVLLARAQSALRSAVGDSGGRPDADQHLVFAFLNELLSNLGIYVSEGMKSSDPSDPSEWVDIAGRAYGLQEACERQQAADRQKSHLLKSLKDEAARMSSSVEWHSEDLAQIGKVVEELIAIGLPPSRIEFRDALLPIIHRLPSQAEMSKPFELVLQEVERFRTQPEKSKVAARSAAPTTAVQQVAKLLAGKTLVVIGAEGRREATKAIQRAFGLKELIWVSTSEHESYLDFEPYIAQGNVAAVLLLIRWSSHSFGNVKELCVRYGKPLVRLPGGYNPNQVAAAIMAQASKRLEP